MLSDIMKSIKLMIPKMYQGLSEITSGLSLIRGNKIHEITDVNSGDPPNPNYYQNLHQIGRAHV